MPQNSKKNAKKITTKKATVKAKVKLVKKTAVKKSVSTAVKKVVTKKLVAKKMHAAKPIAKKAPVKKAQVAKAVKAPLKTMEKTVAKPAVQKQTVVAKAPVQKPVVPAAVKMAYKVGHHVVYPTHGVGKILAEETQMIGDVELRMLVIAFEKDKMTLRVPVSRATAAGLRPVSSTEQIRKVFLTLKSRARTSRGMWSRRAQEYEAKINSGNIFAIAEVVRDLHQNVDQSERSYSERMIYESALSRLVGELAASEATDHKTATDKLMKLLRGKVAAAAELKEAA